MADRQLQRPPLDAWHTAAGAKLVPFAGWRMPLQYTGIIAEHLAVRSSAGLFDVSHMGQLQVTGAAAIEQAQRQLSNDLHRIAEPGHAQYSMLLNDDAGIEDDLIAYRIADDELLLVVNAANQTHDAQLLTGIAQDVSSGWAMFALQGPAALDALADTTGCDLRAFPPFRFVGAAIANAACIVATTGYTGERGCEVLVPADGAADVWELLVADERVQPCGLGARDTLRLEAGYPLHGSDIGPDTNPLAAGLGFAAPRSVAGGGAAHDRLEAIRAAGYPTRMVAMRVTQRGIPRSGNPVLVDDTIVGHITSGTMSPVLREGIALGWIDSHYAELGTTLHVDIRGSRTAATVVSRPFVRGSL